MDSLIPHRLNLSIPQLKKLLKGHAVQLSKELIGSGAGDKEVHLTPTNAKKLLRAYNSSKGMRLKLGPNEMAITGGNVIATSKDVAKNLINAAGDRTVRAINGSGVSEARKAISMAKSITGLGVNRLNKANRWEGFANKTIRDAIDTAGKAGRVYYDTTSPLAQMGFGMRRRRGGNVIATSKDVAKNLINAGGDRAVRAINGSGRGGRGLYGYGAVMSPAVMPVVGPKLGKGVSSYMPPSYKIAKSVVAKLGKGVATRSKVYRTAMRRNMGVDIDNASIAKPPGGRYNSAVKPASSVMTMSPYQGTNSPAMHPFVPMTAYQNSGVSYNIH
jgi:hypothetical protein